MDNDGDNLPTPALLNLLRQFILPIARNNASTNPNPAGQPLQQQPSQEVDMDDLPPLEPISPHENTSGMKHIDIPVSSAS